MKNWKIFLFVTIITIVTNTNPAQLQLLDKTVAIVNNDVILESDIDNLMQLIRLNAAQISVLHIKDTILYDKILEHLILNEIIFQIGQKIGIKITDEQLNKMINNIAKQHNITPKQMYTQLIQNGINFNIYRNQVYKEMIFLKVRNHEVSRRVVILPKEVEALVKEMNTQNNSRIMFNLEHILIPLPHSPTSNQIIKAKNQAYSIVNQAYNGSDLASLTTAYSSANHETLQAKQLGWRYIQDLPFIFTQALSNAKKGDIVGPILSRMGFHILKVNDLDIKNENTICTEVHIRHILLKPSSCMTDEQIRIKLQQISNNIKNGKINFENAARKFSHDLGSANQGGDLNWKEIDAYDSAIRNALTKLKRGQISNPVRSSAGWHLIQLLDTRNIDKFNSIQQQNNAYQILFDRKFYEEENTWIQEQRSSAYVKVLSK